MTIGELRQHRFFQIFEELSAIPRESQNEKQVSDYLVDFAKRRGLPAIQDEANNVLIRKPASPGYENAAPMALQCHMDIVCEKRPDVLHDFAKDPIRMRVEDGMLIANGTTLGADDGFGMCYILAVLEDESLRHPALEGVFTVDEERGMTGMQQFDLSQLTARRMINLDSDEEGVMSASCAGGVSYTLRVPVTMQPSAETKPFRLSLEGLCGGHSGVDIAKERGNSALLLARVLSRLADTVAVGLADIICAGKTNAIPRDAYATIHLREADIAAAQASVEETAQIIGREYAVTEPGLKIALLPAAHSGPVLDDASLRRALAAFLLVPNGAFSFNPSLPGVLDSSSNLGVVSMDENMLLLRGLARSNTNSKIDANVEKLQALAMLLGAELETDSPYPAWEFREDSALRELCNEVYHEMYNGKMEIAAIHGGLECALVAGKLPEMDMVSFGPDILDAHTPQERMNVDSFVRLWNYILRVLECAK